MNPHLTGPPSAPEPAAQLAARSGRARTALVVVFAVNGALLASWAARIPAVSEAAELTTGQLGVALIAPAAGALVAFEVAGRAAARYGSARVTALCAATFCALLPLVAVADTGLGPLFLALLVFGAGNGALDVVMNTHGVAVEQALGRPALSGMHAAFSAGGLAGAAIGGAAASAGIGTAVHFSAISALALASVLTVARWLPLAPAALPAAPITGPADRDGQPETRGGQRSGAALPRPVWLLGAVGFACLLGEGAAADWSAVYLHDSVGASPGLAAAGYAGFSAAMLIGRLLGDRLRATVPAVRLLSACAALAGAGLLLGLVVGGVAAGIVGFTLFGAGLAVIIPVVFAAAGQLPREHTGLPASTALARVNALGYLGFLAGPPLVGALAALTDLRLALLLPVALTGAVVLLARPALASTSASR